MRVIIRNHLCEYHNIVSYVDVCRLLIFHYEFMKSDVLFDLMRRTAGWLAFHNQKIAIFQKVIVRTRTFL